MSALLALADFIFLMNAAGRKKDRDGIVLSGLNKLPFDLYLAGTVLIALLITNPIYSFSDFTRSMWQGGRRDGCSYGAWVCWCLPCACPLPRALKRAVGGKTQSFIVSCGLYTARCARLFKAVGDIFRNLPLLWKTIVLFIGYLFINFVFIPLLFGRASGIGVLFGLLFNLAILAGLCILMLQLNIIKRGAQRIAAGDFDSKLDTARMRWDIKAHAETLNNIQNGMAAAVEERMKSELLKTELISNVSHDVKTPLTSIINYVDLLKKETIDNETATAYIEVLDRQSYRLKS